MTKKATRRSFLTLSMMAAGGAIAGVVQAMGYSFSQPEVHCYMIAAASVEQLAANVAFAQGFQLLRPRSPKLNNAPQPNGKTTFFPGLDLKQFQGNLKGRHRYNWHSPEDTES